MRFCPFCSAENADELAACQACGRRLPPLPPRRTRNAPPTGVQLPPRAVSTTQQLPRRTQPTVPPAPPPGPVTATSLHAVAPPGPVTASAPTVPPADPPTAVVPAAPPAGPVTASSLLAVAPPPAPIVDRESVPALPPPPAAVLPAIPSVAEVRADDAARRALLGAISPGPAAQRREPAPSPPRAGGEPGRRRSDGTGTLPPPIPAAARTAPLPLAPISSLDHELIVLSETPVAPPPIPSTPARGLRPTTIPPTPPSAPPAAAPPEPVVIAPATRPSAPAVATEPPATRIQRGDGHAERPFTPPRIVPVPEIPEPGLANAARYAIRFARARYQRRGAIKALSVEIKQDTEALDQVLGALGRQARAQKVEGRVFSAENAAITAAEERIAQLGREQAEVDARKADENSRFGEVERERTAKLSEAERAVAEAQRELIILETQRRGLRDKRKDLERRQKAHLKAAEEQDRQAGAAQMGDQRTELRRAGESHRREAAALEPERQDGDRQLAAIERPIAEATAKQDAAKAELDAAKRSLADAREGHTHRLAELDAEAKRKAREAALAESEIARRLVTLGTLVNLNRSDDPSFGELYQRIDRLRGAITARTTEIEKLTAERDAFDRGMLVRGVSVIGGAAVALIALIVILRAIL